MKRGLLFLSLLAVSTTVSGQEPRARDLGIVFDGTPGTDNAITDVPGVEVGHGTLITRGPDYGARTGVTAVFPLGREARDGVLAGWFALNGTGEMTGMTYVEETGRFFGPVMTTGTLGLSTVYRATLEWTRRHFPAKQDLYRRHLPIVAETYDGFVNEQEFAFPLGADKVVEALDGARGGPVAEGNVGGGTGMMTNEFSGGIGTASRMFEAAGHRYTLGVLVQSNQGKRNELIVAGVPVGRELTGDMPEKAGGEARDGSIIVIVATDAPLLPDQLKRVARHVSIGLAHAGGRGNAGSGDLFLAFTTANRMPVEPRDVLRFESLPSDQMTPVFAATIAATEEAIVNALVAGRTIGDPRGNVIHGLPHEALRRVLRKYGRLGK